MQLASHPYPTRLTAVKLLHQALISRLACLAQVPPFDSALPGITIMTLMELIPEVHPSCALSLHMNICWFAFCP